VKRLLTSCFGLGFMPIASGTWGSLPPAFIFAGMCLLGSGWGLIAANAVLMVVLAILASVVCVKFTPHVVKLAGKKDPGEIVADEFAGQSVTFIGAYASGYKEIAIVAVAGFLLFRLFDIFKPWPIRNLEKLPDGWGVLADDLLAGVFAGIVLQVIMIVFI
jgi:phosphatidylglycerophosphatase A